MTDELDTIDWQQTIVASARLLINTPVVQGYIDWYSITERWVVNLDRTITPALTVGAQTINKPSWTVNMWAWQSSLVVTNSLVTTSSIIFAIPRTADATCVVKSVVPANWSFTITTESATAETSIGFFLLNT